MLVVRAEAWKGSVMADDGASETIAVQLDDEGKRLQLEAEKSKYREAIAKAAQGTAEVRASLFQGLVPDLEGVPTGTVTLGEKAGAFGSWLAHETVAVVADTITEAVVEYLKRRKSNNERLLVVDDRALLTGAATARLGRDRLVRMAAQLTPLAAQLREADRHLESAAKNNEPAVEGFGEGGGEGGAPEGGAAGAAEEKPAMPGAGAALGSALDLVSLLRTDYTLTAAEVRTSPSELATLSAARLGASGAVPGLTVEIDGFTAANASEILDRVNSVTTMRDAVRSELAALQARLSPVEAELTALRARIDSLEDAGATWAAAAERSPDGGQTLRTKIDELYRLAAPRAKAAATARAKVDQARGVLDEVDAGLSAMMQASATTDPPLLTAVRWERLRHGATAGPVHHVLYVGIDQVAADTVTRRSLLGTSGRISFLGAATVSWLLMEPEHGAVRAGGSLRGGRILQLDLESGNSELVDLTPGGRLDKDPLRKLEAAASVGVVAIAVLLCILAVVVAIRLALG
jgi:hypothetical protein